MDLAHLMESKESDDDSVKMSVNFTAVGHMWQFYIVQFRLIGDGESVDFVLIVVERSQSR